MPENPLQPSVDAGVSKLRAQLDAIDRQVGRVAPVNKRLMTRREKLLSSLATPANTWTPEQAMWVLKEMRRMRKAT